MSNFVNISFVEIPFLVGCTKSPLITRFNRLISLFFLKKLSKISSYKGNKYSVPHYFASKEVWLRLLYGTTLQIYSSKNKLIASHSVSMKKGDVIIDKEHYSGYRNDNNCNYY